MAFVPRLLVGLVAALHLGIAAAELFFWESSALVDVRRSLGLDRRGDADKVAPIMVNVGLYTIFVAVGLIWSLFLGERPARTAALFLGFAVVAGLFSASTIPGLWPMLVLQALPAAAALVALGVTGGLSRDPAADYSDGTIPLGEPDAVEVAQQIDAKEPETDGDAGDSGPSSAVYIHRADSTVHAAEDHTPAAAQPLPPPPSASPAQAAETHTPPAEPAAAHAPTAVEPSTSRAE